MKFKERVTKVLEILDKQYPKDIKCYLNHENAWQLLIATILSAQCTDDRVNIITKDLFTKYKSIEDFADADIKQLQKDIRSTGFYRNKAKNIKACSIRLISQYNGIVPNNIEELIKLEGVGRKTANVILGNIFNQPSIVVDTHVKRISYKLGFTTFKDPVKIEVELMDILPKEHWIRYNTQIIAHGRKICIARRAKCEECFLLPYCPTGLKERLKCIE